MPPNRKFSFNAIALVLAFSCWYIQESNSTDVPWIDKDGFLIVYPEEPNMELRECRPCKIPTLKLTTGNNPSNNDTVVCFGADGDITEPSHICESASNDNEPHIQRLTSLTFTSSGRSLIKVLSLKKYVMKEWEGIDVTFSDLTSLTHLYLENNHITSLKPSGNSSHLRNLTVLSLAHNPITHLTSDSLSWLKDSELSFLNLRGCSSLKQVDLGALLPLCDHALFLDLSHSALTVESLQNVTGAFEDTDADTGLQALGLSQIGISEMHIEALKNVSHSLKKLSMQGNRLSDWQTTLLSNLSFPELTKLNLKHNDFSHYPGYLFTETPKLDELILDGNPLTDLDCRTLQNLSSLSLKSIKNSFSWGNCSLPSLNSSDFTNSPLSTSLLNFTFFQNSSLEMLKLRNTNASITDLGLNNLQNLRYLDLRNNSEIGKNMQEILFTGLQKLRFISLRSCAIRAILSANLLEPLTELQELDLSFNFITTLNNRVFSKLKNLESLNLRDNHITSFPPNIFRYTKLSYLNLENNWFTEISEVMIKGFNDLKVDNVTINLSNNPYICRCLSVSFLQLFDQQKDMKIKLDSAEENSSYECTTRRNSTQLSIKQALEHFNMMDSSFPWEDDYSCTKEEETTTFVSSTTPPGGNEKPNPDQLKYILIGCSVIFVLLLLSVSCYWKWWNIRLFAYLVKKTVVLSILKDESEIKYKRKTSYQYDVFVSFSDSNRTWILEELIPHLEHQCHIKVCLHERDFQAGLPILENIISCMDRSRSILLVLSQAFLQSHWCQFELNLAQHRLLEMRRDQLLLVLLEDIPRNKCSKMLRYLLLTKTYIQWPRRGSDEDKKAFWKKMRKALGPRLDSKSVSNV